MTAIKRIENQFLAAARKRRAEALDMRAKGDTYAEIGKALGISWQRAQQLVKQAQADRARPPA